MRSQSYGANTAGRSNSSGSIPVTTRNLESLIRLAQARARMELREQVTLLFIILQNYCLTQSFNFTIFLAFMNDSTFLYKE